MSDNTERRQQILDAAAVIIRLGYDKSTMSDIAQEAGAGRRTVYLYFEGKEEQFEELPSREYLLCAQIWLEQLEADPAGWSRGGPYRALFHAVNRRPLIAAMLRRDRREPSLCGANRQRAPLTRQLNNRAPNRENLPFSYKILMVFAIRLWIDNCRASKRAMRQGATNDKR